MTATTSDPKNPGDWSREKRLSRFLLERVPADAESLIEIGCRRGDFGRAFKRANPAAHIVGVEVDRERGGLAREELDRVVAGSVEDLPDEAVVSGPGAANVILINDVLQWFRDPLGQLQRFAPWLAIDGLLVAAVTALGPRARLRDLLLDSATKSDERRLRGIRSFIARFSNEGIRELFQRGRWSLIDISVLSAEPGGQDLLSHRVGSTLARLGHRPDSVLTHLSPALWVIRARTRPEPVRRLFIQTVTLRPQGAMLDVRVHTPDRCSRTLPGIRMATRVANPDLGLAAAADEEKVLVWQRPILLYPDGVRALRRLLADDYLIVLERDDYPWRPEFAAHRYLSFRGVHAIQVSTETLAGVVRQWNPEVAVFGNQLAELPPYRAASEGEPVTLFFGALNREDEWAPLMPVLNRILRRYRGRVRVQVIHDRAFFDALETGDKDFEPLCPYDRYQSILRRCDVALLPLEDNLFNRCKSDLKFIECAAHGVAVLASPVVYGESVVDGETGFLFRDGTEMTVRLGRLIEDADLRGRLTRAAHGYVRDRRMMAYHCRERTRWYRSLRERVPELNRRLHERVPELFDG